MEVTPIMAHARGGGNWALGPPSAERRAFGARASLRSAGRLRRRGGFGQDYLLFILDDGIVVSRSERDDAMDVDGVSPALRERLGAEATVGLLALLEASRQKWAADVTNQAVERFERHLTQGIGVLRDEMREGHAALRTEIGAMREDQAALRTEVGAMREDQTALRTEIGAVDASVRAEISLLRTEMRDGDATLRTEMREGHAVLRTEIREGDAAVRLELRDMSVTIGREIAALGATLRKEMADQRVELFKWSFAFWFGQIVTLGGLMTLLFRRFVS
ncbi:MAG TPA: hypothetical protein VMO26_12675 [Vicinamibacterales bacterium]|nr:hypothetical protein [Vicinamibacterales bacterium]